VVVFPEQTLPLHIFEDRYKKMIADCAQQGSDDYSLFGLNYEHEGDIAPVGCAVQVMKVTRQYSNGTFDIICRALWRYRIIDVRDHERSYLVAQVEPLNDDEDGPVDPALQMLVEDRLRQLTQLVGQDMGGAGFGSQADELESLSHQDDADAFAIAQRIGLEPSRRQQLLELLGENDRLQYLAEFLDQLLPTVQQRQDRQRRVKTNGHTPSG
jgi:ATP-dependent Lon protease